jgi:hypothetical protein
MKAFWNHIARGLTAAALWCASHPSVVQAVVTEAVTL